MKTKTVPFRDHQCWSCGFNWSTPINLSKNTWNLSGELYWCPKCHKQASMSSPVYEFTYNDEGERT